MHSILRCYILYGEEMTRRKGICALVTQHQGKTSQELIRVWNYQMGGTPSSARIIQYVDQALKALKISTVKMVL